MSFNFLILNKKIFLNIFIIIFYKKKLFVTNSLITIVRNQQLIDNLSNTPPKCFVVNQKLPSAPKSQMLDFLFLKNPKEEKNMHS